MRKNNRVAKVVVQECISTESNYSIMIQYTPNSTIVRIYICYTVFVLFHDMLTQSEQQYYDLVAENMASYSLETTPWSEAVYTRELAKPVSQPTHKIMCIF